MKMAISIFDCLFLFAQMVSAGGSSRNISVQPNAAQRGSSNQNTAAGIKSRNDPPLSPQSMFNSARFNSKPAVVADPGESVRGVGKATASSDFNDTYATIPPHSSGKGGTLSSSQSNGRAESSVDRGTKGLFGSNTAEAVAQKTPSSKAASAFATTSLATGSAFVPRLKVEGKAGGSSGEREINGQGVQSFASGSFAIITPAVGLNGQARVDNTSGTDSGSAKFKSELQVTLNRVNGLERASSDGCANRRGSMDASSKLGGFERASSDSCTGTRGSVDGTFKVGTRGSMDGGKRVRSDEANSSAAPPLQNENFHSAQRTASSNGKKSTGVIQVSPSLPASFFLCKNVNTDGEIACWGCGLQ